MKGEKVVKGLSGVARVTDVTGLNGLNGVQGMLGVPGVSGARRSRAWLAAWLGAWMGACAAALLPLAAWPAEPASAAPSVAAPIQDIYDPPSVDVFPEHERIGVDYPLQRAIADGRRLFMARFNAADGAGRPLATAHAFPTARSEPGPAFHRVAGPDANSCAGCHNQPAIGGSGDFATNVFVAAPQFGVPINDSINPMFADERHTRSLFGIGGVEIAAVEMSEDLQALRDQALARARTSGAPVEQALESKGVRFGSITVAPDGDMDTTHLEGVSPDLIVKPFGAKGVFTSIRDFSVVALNQHHGMEAQELFGEARTGKKNFGGGAVPVPISVGQATAIALFQAALPAPDNRGYERQPGFAVFKQVGCDSCHRPKMYLRSHVFQEPNPFNREGVLTPAETRNHVRLPLPLAHDRGGYYINAFTDLRRHSICDERNPRLCNERKKQDKVPLDEFMTSRLWALNTSAPYCHRGDCSTLTEAIEAHGGEATAVRERFDALAREDKVALVRFLHWLGAREAAQ